MNPYVYFICERFYKKHRFEGDLYKCKPHYFRWYLCAISNVNNLQVLLPYIRGVWHFKFFDTFDHTWIRCVKGLIYGNVSLFLLQSYNVFSIFFIFSFWSFSLYSFEKCNPFAFALKNSASSMVSLVSA